MHHMGNAIECSCHDIAIGDRAANDVNTVGRLAQTVMTKCANTGSGKFRLVKQPSNEALPDLARRTGNKDQHALSPTDS